MNLKLPKLSRLSLILSGPHSTRFRSFRSLSVDCSRFHMNLKLMPLISTLAFDRCVLARLECVHNSTLCE